MDWTGLGLGYTPRRMGANIFDTLMQKAEQFLEKKAVEYMTPKPTVPDTSITPAASAPAPAPVRMTPVAPVDEGVPTWVYVAGGIGAVAILTGVAVAVLRKRK